MASFSKNFLKYADLHWKSYKKHTIGFGEFSNSQTKEKTLQNIPKYRNILWNIILSIFFQELLGIAKIFHVNTFKFQEAIFYFRIVFKEHLLSTTSWRIRGTCDGVSAFCEKQVICRDLQAAGFKSMILEERPNLFARTNCSFVEVGQAVYCTSSPQT